MPIHSIQYRTVTEKYQNQTYRRKISKIVNSCTSYEVKNLVIRKETSTFLKHRKVEHAGSKNQNATTTSLVLLLLLTLLHTEVDAFPTKNSVEVSTEANPDLNIRPLFKDGYSSKFVSRTEQPSKIPQDIVPLFANPLLEYPIDDDHISIYKPQSLINKVTERENKRVSSFLKREGFLDRNKKVTKEEIILAALTYCFNDDFHNSRRIARRILSSSRPYRSEKHEILSRRQVETIISNWIFENVLNTSPAIYIAKIISKDTDPFRYTINDIIELFSLQKLQKEGMINLKTLSVEMRSDFERIWENYLRKEMPFFKFYDEDEKVGTILLDDIEFSNLYTGSKYLFELDCLHHFNKSEVLELGQKMWDQAIVEGVSIVLEPYFFVPSLLFEAQNNPQKIKETENIYDSSEIIITEELTYRERVQQIYKIIMDKLDKYKEAISKWYKIKQSPQSTNEELNNMSAEVIARFFELDEYLIFSALNSIEEDEINFIFSSDTIIRPITLSLHRKNPGPIIVPFYGTRCLDENYRKILCVTTSTTIPLNKTDLFSVQLNGKERVYALKSREDKYNLVRVDRDINKYIKEDIFQDKEIKQEDLINNNEIKIGNRIFSFHFDSNGNFVKETGESITKFIDFLRNIHRDNLHTSLYEINNDPLGLQTLTNFFKHFIPLYDCIDGIINKNSEQAILACSLDSILLVPLIGESIYAEEKFSLQFVKRMRTSGISLTNSFDFITKNSATLGKIKLPTITQLNTVEDYTLKSLHSGFRLLSSISSKYTNSLINFLKKDIKTIAISEKLDSIILKEESSHFPHSYITARLPNSEIRVPIRKVGEIAGKDLYAIINPDTGETAWARFILKENNQLVSLETIPEISISKALEEMIVPDMYVNNLDIEKLSAPDYMGLRWDNDHINAYIKFKDEFLRIKIINNQPFLLSNAYNIPLVIKNHKLKPEGLLHRLNRLRKIGLGGKNLTPKQVIATKLNISEEEAADLLDAYQFPEKSKYYSDRTFSLWVKETGQIPSWAEAFKILKLGNYVSRFKNIKIQSNHLCSFAGGEGFVYRADETPPDIVLAEGFKSSEDYTAIEKMIPESELGLIVSGDITGVLRYNQLAKSPYIYKIQLENIRGVSLQENLMKNQAGLKTFFAEDPEEKYTTLESLAHDSNGAIYLNEIHLYNDDVKSEYISLVTEKEIEEAQPLAEGPWKNYL